MVGWLFVVCPEKSSLCSQSMSVCKSLCYWNYYVLSINQISRFFSRKFQYVTKFLTFIFFLQEIPIHCLPTVCLLVLEILGEKCNSVTAILYCEKNNRHLTCQWPHRISAATSGLNSISCSLLELHDIGNAHAGCSHTTLAEGSHLMCFFEQYCWINTVLSADGGRQWNGWKGFVGGHPQRACTPF